MNWLDHLHFGKGVFVVGVLIVLMVLERKFPLVVVRFQLNRLGRNFSMAGLNIVLGPLIVIPITTLAVGLALHWRPEWWSGWLGLGLDLLILDFWIYIWHRLNHVVPFLWRFHEVHHLDETLDASSGLRFHFGEVVLSSLARALVVFLLAVPFQDVVIFETLLTLAALFHHSNVRLAPGFERALAYVIVTPSIHWVHHHALRQDTDSNYSTILSLWDGVFRSRSLHKRDVDMKIGVEGLSDVPLLRLILRPFYKA